MSRSRSHVQSRSDCQRLPRPWNSQFKMQEVDMLYEDLKTTETLQTEVARMLALMGEQQAAARVELAKALADFVHLQATACSESEQSLQQQVAARKEVASLKQEIESLQVVASEKRSAPCTPPDGGYYDQKQQALEQQVVVTETKIRQPVPPSELATMMGPISFYSFSSKTMASKKQEKKRSWKHEQEYQLTKWYKSSAKKPAH